MALLNETLCSASALARTESVLYGRFRPDLLGRVERVDVGLNELPDASVGERSASKSASTGGQGLDHRGRNHATGLLGWL